MRLIDADAFCTFLREVSTRQHYETLLTNKDKFPTVADVIEAICCDLDGTSLNGFDNAPTVEMPKALGTVDEKGNIKIELLRPQGEWISAGERLPDDMQKVLIWFEYFRYGDFNCMYQTYGFGYVLDGKWSPFINGETGWQDYNIIAWQPLPEPYKEGGAE